MSVESHETMDAEAAPDATLPDCGQRVSIESPRHEEKFWTQMIGFKPGAYLVLEKPPGAEAVEGKRALKDGDSLVIRFMKDGSIFGFRTPVLSTLSLPYKLLFVAYPVEVVRHSLRSSPRLQCHLPCDGEVGGRLFSRAFIRDFSATGCQLRIPRDALAEEDALVEEDALAEEGVAAYEGEPAPVEAKTEAGVEGEPEAFERADPAAPKRLTLNMQLPGEEEIRVADGEVLEWQSLSRYHLLRVKFDELQLEVFEQLTLYTTQLG